MVKCIVPGCDTTNSTDKDKHIIQKTLEQSIKISLHRLPKNINKRKLWLKNIGLDENINLKKTASICSLHFKEEDINRTLDKIYLRENAVPYATAFIDSTSTAQADEQENVENEPNYLNLSVSSADYCSDHQHSYLETSFSSIETHSKKKFKNQESICTTNEQILDECTGKFITKVKRLPTDQMQEDCTTMLDETNFIDRGTSPIQLFENLNEKVHRSTSVSPQHFQNNKDCDKETIKYLKASLEEYKQKSQRTIRNLKRKIKREKPETDTVMASLKSQLNKNNLQMEQLSKFSKDFLKRLIFKCENKTINKQYSPELRSFALTLNYYSPKAYNYVRKKFECILPHPKTLYKWYTSVDGNPGFNLEALKAIEARCKAVNYPLFGAVIFDEMDIKSEIERVGSKVYGMVDFGGMEKYININNTSQLAKQVLVFTVVCINGSWKIPFAYFFIDSLKTDNKKMLILKSLELLHAFGLNVASLTFDGAAVNMSVMKELTGFNIHEKNEKNNFQTYFLHPVTEEKVFIFLDPSHMLKLVRNCFGDFRTIIAEDGKVSWKYFEELHSVQEKEGLHLANKLRNKHLNYRKQKMKVRLAAQLFSKSVADSLIVLKNMNIFLFKNSTATIRFINIFNDLFDIMNSKSLKSSHFKKPLKYCEEDENQQNYNKIIHEKLFECEKYILNLKTENSEKLIFTKRKTGFIGFLICIYSLQQLYHELCENRKLLKYIPTYKISQDHIELLFGCIRTHNGCNNNPTARQLVGIFKKILVHHELRTNNTGNCIPQENISILHVTSRIDPVNVINMTTPSIKHVLAEVSDETDRNLINTKIDTDTERLLTLINNFDTHSYVKNPCTVSEITETIISYIAGFVVKSLQREIKCEDCLKALESDTKSSNLSTLISIKSRGFLIYPSTDVIFICTKAEKIIKMCLHESGGKFLLKKFSDQFLMNLIKRSLISCDLLFSNLKDHNNNQSILESHSVYLIEAIIKKFLKIRLHYICSRSIDKSDSDRQKFTKLIQHKHQ